MAVGVTMPWLFQPGDGEEGDEQQQLLQKQIEEEAELEKDGDPADGYDGQSKNVNDSDDKEDKEGVKAERQDVVRRE